jgi:oligopeptide/dipeptide ABC transporter ATP-binding protein
MGDTVLSVSNLKVHFFTYDGVVQAIENVSFEIGRREVFGLVGETGCGKTVTGLTVLRLLPENAKILNGKVILNTDNLLAKSDGEMRVIRGKGVSMIFQDPASSLNPVFTLQNQLMRIIAEHLSSTGSDARKRLLEMLKEVGLPEPSRVLGLYPHELSGGMQQRVMIAAALLCNPSLLIADEPTSAIDVTIQAQILSLLKQLRQEVDLSILLITHNMGVVAEICDRVGVMYAGRIVETGSVRDVLKDPRHPYTRALLGAIPKPGIEKKLLKEIKGTVPSLLNPPSGCRFHPRCPYATEICSIGELDFTPLGEGHQVACHNPQRG